MIIRFSPRWFRLSVCLYVYLIGQCAVDKSTGCSGIRKCPCVGCDRASVGGVRRHRSAIAIARYLMRKKKKKKKKKKKVSKLELDRL